MLVQPNSTYEGLRLLYVCEHTKANRAEIRIKQEEIEIETKQHTQHNCLWEQAQRDHVFHKEGQSSTPPRSMQLDALLHFAFLLFRWNMDKKGKEQCLFFALTECLGEKYQICAQDGGKNRQSISFDSLKSKYYCPISRWTVNRERTKSQKKGGQREMGGGILYLIHLWNFRTAEQGMRWTPDKGIWPAGETGLCCFSALNGEKERGKWGAMEVVNKSPNECWDFRLMTPLFVCDPLEDWYN